MRVAPATVERIKSHFRLSEVIGRYVALRRAGREFHALCPFHNEKTPSFTVNDEKGFFHCFGCGAHGDVIGFIKDIERLEYREALERLAAEAGVELPKYSTPEAEAEMERSALLYQVLEKACTWFERQLQGALASDARDYVRERGISGEIMARFRIGFSPNERDALKSAMKKEGIAEQLLVDAGLLIKPDSGAAYDRFRGRLMFPIRDMKGRVIAFGGRILPAYAHSSSGQTIAKYLNSPETELFHKGEILFALGDARKTIYDKQQVIVTEGYMDAIALHQAGFTHAVAPLGTAVSESHLNLLWRYASEPIFCLDGDSAGQKAMLRVADMALPLLKSGKGLRFALLPKGEDPDSLIRSRGAPAMSQLLAKSMSLSEILWESQRQAIGQETPERTAQLEAKLMQLCERIVDRTLRSHFRSYFRRRLWVKESSQQTRAESKSRLAQFSSVTEKQGLVRIEKEIMTLLICSPELLQQAEIEESAARMDFSLSGQEGLRQMLLALFHEIETLDTTQARAALALRGYADAVDELFSSSINKLPKSLTEEPWRAQAFWDQFHTIYIAEKSIEEQRGFVAQPELSDNPEAVMKVAQMIEESKRSRSKRHYVDRVLEPTDA